MHAWYHQYMLHSLDISTSAPFHLSVLFWSILNRQVPSEKRKDLVVQFSWARGGFNPTEPPGCYSSLKHLKKPTAFIVFKLLGCSRNMSGSNSWTMPESNFQTMLGIHTCLHTHIPGLHTTHGIYALLPRQCQSGTTHPPINSAKKWRCWPLILPQKIAQQPRRLPCTKQHSLPGSGLE